MTKLCGHTFYIYFLVIFVFKLSNENFCQLFFVTLPTTTYLVVTTSIADVWINTQKNEKYFLFIILTRIGNR